MELAKKPYNQEAYITSIYFLVFLDGNPRSIDLFTTVRNYCFKTEMEAYLFQAENREQFNTALDQIKQDVISRNVRPLVHFDGHGSEKGLLLPSGAIIRWENLAQRLEYINLKARNSLFLTFATCYGNNICNHFDKKYFNPQTSRSPAYGIVAPYHEIQEGNVEQAYELFFKRLLDDRNLSLAVNELDESALFEIRFSDMIYLMICRFMTESQHKRAYSSRTQFNAYLSEVGRMFTLKTGKIMTEQDYNVLAHHFNKKQNYLKFLEHIRTQFFMIDLYPENDKLFSRITNDDLIGWKSY